MTSEEDINQKIRRYAYIKEKERRSFQRSEKTSEQYRELENKIDETGKEIKEIQFKFIEILAIFTALSGFLFGFIRFSTDYNLKFHEIWLLLITLSIILGVFILLIHSLFNPKKIKTKKVSLTDHNLRDAGII